MTRKATALLEALRPALRELVAPVLPEGPGAMVRWLVATYLVFLFFFVFQAYYPPQGYIPYSGSVWVSPVWKSILAAVLFFGLLIAAAPPAIAMRIMHWWLLGMVVAGVLYMGLVVSARPELASMNDRAQALTVAGERLLAGEFSYAEPTHLGNPVTPLTGSIMLALPSILAFGRPEVTGVVLLFGFILLTAFVQAGRRPLVPLFAIWGIALLNPALVRELALGSDLVWGPLLVGAGAVLLARGHVIAGGLVFALGLATRLSMVPLLPLWVVAVYMLNGRRQAMAFAATALGALLLMHLPFAVWDPSTYFGYAPLGISAEKVSQQLPEGDNLMADLMAFVLPEGPARPMVVSALMAAGGVLLGFLARSLSHLLLLSSALLMASLFFVGSYFLLDYLVVCIFPACFAFLLENDGESPLQGARESNARDPAGHDAGISA